MVMYIHLLYIIFEDYPNSNNLTSPDGIIRIMRIWGNDYKTAYNQVDMITVYISFLEHIYPKHIPIGHVRKFMTYILETFDM